MTDDVWRPLGIDSEEDFATYDALHDGIPSWMSGAFWAWVKEELTEYRRGYNNFPIPHLRENDTERMAQALRMELPNLRFKGEDLTAGRKQLASALTVLKSHKYPLQIADYMLAEFRSVGADELEELLSRSNSAWRVGTRAGKTGLVRRVPLGVQDGADIVIRRSGRAGVRLAKAWGLLYGISPDSSGAYRQAILAVEDAAIPIVSPSNKSATLGTVLRQMEDQADWQLPMMREHTKTPSSDVLLGMIRLVWHGQHDRHGGQPSGPGDVGFEEAVVALGAATTLVHWFEAAIVAQEQPPGPSDV